MNCRVIGLDADDTLWHNETIFARVQERYRALLSQYHHGEAVDQTLLATERGNIGRYGYGVKGFTVSAIETAIELTKGRISAKEIQTLIATGREMLAHLVELPDDVASARCFVGMTGRRQPASDRGRVPREAFLRRPRGRPPAG